LEIVTQAVTLDALISCFPVLWPGPLERFSHYHAATLAVASLNASRGVDLVSMSIKSSRHVISGSLSLAFLVHT